MGLQLANMSEEGKIQNFTEKLVYKWDFIFFFLIPTKFEKT